MASTAEIQRRRKRLGELNKRRLNQARRGRKLEARENRIRQRLGEIDGRPNLQQALKKRLRDVRQKALVASGRLATTKQKMRKTRRIKETVPGTPGTPSPTVDPFMTAEDIQRENEARQQLQNTVYDLDQQLATRAADAAYEKTEIDKQRVASRTSASDSMAARGLFHSSVRDAELYDIDATAALRKSFLDRELDTLTLDAQQRKLAASTAFDEFQAAMQQRMVENARQRTEELGLGPWLEAPVPEHTKVTKVKTPKSKASKPKGKKGGGKKGPKNLYKGGSVQNQKYKGGSSG